MLCWMNRWVRIVVVLAIFGCFEFAVEKSARNSYELICQLTRSVGVLLVLLGIATPVRITGLDGDKASQVRSCYERIGFCSGVTEKTLIVKRFRHL